MNGICLSHSWLLWKTVAFPILRGVTGTDDHTSLPRQNLHQEGRVQSRWETPADVLRHLRCETLRVIAKDRTKAAVHAALGSRPWRLW